ncbi:MAG: polyprenyl synthetase family protein [Bacteroidota bacterium]|nr:polyprenyl synthetase family protein [Bacteroidota bacterium]
MYNRTELQEAFNRFLKSQQIVENPAQLYKPVEYSLNSGGKRIRPVLLLMAYQLYHENIDDAMNPALGLEIFHNFTLMHDDIMDKSVMRRGQPTVHSKWNDNVAILSGDVMSIMASQYVLKAKQNHQQLLERYNQAAIDVCKGQQYDMDFEQLKTISEDEYLKMISLKTGALLAVAMEMGGIVADAPKEDIRKLYDFGMKMGIGFQLQDDWLDCFGDESKLGKVIGEDILSEKKTFLFIKAYELADEVQQNALDHALKTHDLPAEDKIQFVLDIYKQLELDELTKQKSDAYFEDALIALKSIQVDEVRKEELYKFLNYLKARSF